MSCLPDCNCVKSVQEEEDSVEEEEIAHVEPSYHPLSEASYVSEAIPLLPKDSTMLKHETKSEHYELLTVIGKGLGNAAIISLAMHLPTKQHVAIRRINLDRCKEDIDYVQNEILYTRQLRHDNILPYLCTFVCNSEIWAVMPLMTFGSAKSIMKSHFHDGLPEIAISFMVKDVLLGLEYLHKRGFIHRGVKASHILLTSNGRAILSGQRYSCNVFNKGRWQNAIHQFPQDSVPNLNWLSPELLAQNLMGYNFKSDIYSVGMTVWELFNGVVPFANILPTQMLLEKLEGNIVQALEFHTTVSNGSNTSGQPKHMENHKLPGSVFMNQHYSDSFQSFIQLCLQKDPYHRPSAAQLCTHTFIKQSKKSQISLLDVLAVVKPIVERLNLQNDDEVIEEVDLSELQTLDLDDYWSF